MATTYYDANSTYPNSIGDNIPEVAKKARQVYQPEPQQYYDANGVVYPYDFQSDVTPVASGDGSGAAYQVLKYDPALFADGIGAGVALPNTPQDKQYTSRDVGMSAGQSKIGQQAQPIRGMGDGLPASAPQPARNYGDTGQAPVARQPVPRGSGGVSPDQLDLKRMFDDVDSPYGGYIRNNTTGKTTHLIKGTIPDNIDYATLPRYGNPMASNAEQYSSGGASSKQSGMQKEIVPLDYRQSAATARAAIAALNAGDPNAYAALEQQYAREKGDVARGFINKLDKTMAENQSQRMAGADAKKGADKGTDQTYKYLTKEDIKAAEAFVNNEMKNPIGEKVDPAQRYTEVLRNMNAQKQQERQFTLLQQDIAATKGDPVALGNLKMRAGQMLNPSVYFRAFPEDAPKQPAKR